MQAGRRAPQSGTPSRFDSSFYRAHDPIGYISSDVRSLKSQATYSSGLPVFATSSGPFGSGMQRNANGSKRSTYGGYAASIISQDAGQSGSIDTTSVAGSAVPAALVAYSQSDRLRRRPSFTSVAGVSDMGSLSSYEYKTNDDADLDDIKSQYTGTQAGVTVF